MSKQIAWVLTIALGWGLVGCGFSGSSDDSGEQKNGLPDPNSGSGAANGSSSHGVGGSSGSSAAIGSGGSSQSASGGTGAAVVPSPSGTGGGGGSGGTFAGEVDDGSSVSSGAAPGDRYDTIGTNPFVLTSYDPLSTFAVDADTASYDIFRRDVNNGVLPDSSSVRLEEYVNNFAYHYPPPAEDAEDPFAIHLAASPSLYDTGTLLLRVGIQGKEAPSERGPANIVFLVDVSGSMSSADKLPLVKVVLEEALNVLRPTDRISIVTYAGFTSVALAPTPVSEKATIKAVIDRFEAGGSTAGGSGMTLAYEQASLGFVEGGINHIVMCTDGDFNVGISSTDDLLALIEEKRQTGITLTTLGFGSGNLNDSMMEKVSNAGNGMYSVISSEDQAITYANQRLLSTMIHIAKDMKIQVEFNSDRVLAYRLLGYEDRAIADDDFRDDTVDAGEIGAGHRVTALYELVLDGTAVPVPDGAPKLVEGNDYDGSVEVGKNDLVLVKVRYKQPGAAESDPAKEVNTSLPASAAAASYEDLDVDFRWSVAVATFAEILKKSPFARPEQLDVIGRIIKSDPDATTGQRGEFATLFTNAVRMVGAK